MATVIYTWSLNGISRMIGRRAVNETLGREFESFKIKGVNCGRIIQGDKVEITKAKNLTPRKYPSDETLIRHTTDCDQFKELYGYHGIVNTEEEKDFPIAYNILLYKDVPQVELLLRAIYRPQNYYCLHVDGFSPGVVHEAAKSLARCFHNVFIVSKTENVVYESFQRLKADLNCMEDHLRHNDWKYLINLPGQEFPLKTNAEIVKILKIMNDTNYVECIRGSYMIIPARFRYKYKNVFEENGRYRLVKTSERNPKPPHGIILAKGSAYGIFTHGFVDFMVNNQTAKDFLEFTRGILSPDEYYWSTLNHNPFLNVPGSGKEPCNYKFLLSTYISWGYRPYPDPCRGKRLRGVCVFGLDDLVTLAGRRELFVNKLELRYSYATLQCLGEWIYNKTVSPPPIDEMFYKTLYYNKTHNLPLRES